MADDQPPQGLPNCKGSASDYSTDAGGLDVPALGPAVGS